MPSIERTITVDKPLELVWEFLSDFTNTEQWDPPTVSTVRTRGDGGVGTVYHNVSKILGHEAEVEYTVTEHHAPVLLKLRGTATGLELEDTIRLEASGAQVTVTYTADFEPQGAAKLVEPLLPLGLKKLGDDAASRLHEVLSGL